MLYFIKIAAPFFMSMGFTFSYYYKFYTHSPLLLGILCLCAAVFSLCFTMPENKGVTAFLLSMFMPFITLYIFTYNFIFASAMLIIAVISSILRKSTRYTKIIFTENNTPICINHTKKAGAFPFMRKVFTALVPVVFALGFVFYTPSPLWLVRAFPIDLSSEDTFTDSVIPSGQITSTAWYDDNALSIASFYDIDSEIPSPGYAAGLRAGDIVVKINNQRALTSDFITNGAGSEKATLTVKRRDENGLLAEHTFTVTPVYSQSEGKYLIGITYYSTAAISASVQTVSFSYPDTGYFAATAHSSDDLYEDMPALKGVLMKSAADGRDEDGIIALPKEIMGVTMFSDNYGCYGILDNPEGDAVPIAKKSEFRLGKATLLSSFEGDSVQKYEVYIIGTYRIDQRDVLFLIVTDPRIIAHGGIARGMSGSPIIQNGKLIGALSNMDEGGYTAYATFALDMAQSLYLNQDKLL